MSQQSASTDAGRTPLTVVHLDATCADEVEFATARVPLTIGNRSVQLVIRLPPGEAEAMQLLPIYHGLANLVVDAAEGNVIGQGKSISCRKGCGACCRQPVPISETEARAIAQLVDELPEPRRTLIRLRFSEAHARLETAGLLNRYLHPERLTSVELMSLTAEYFALGIACPFLEDESCSIHSARPLACREYLVTSPAENCSSPTTAAIEPVPLAARVAAAVRAADREGREDKTGWVLLSVAPDWAAHHPEAERRPATELLQEFFNRLAPQTDWVHESNLRPFLTAVGWALAAEFGPGDWLAVEEGLKASDDSQNGWFEFSYASAQSGRLLLARGKGGVVRIRSQMPSDLEAQLRLATAMCQQFTLKWA